MDQDLRRRIQKMVAEARQVLEADVRERLEGVFGVTSDRLEPIDKVSTLTSNPARKQERREIEAAIQHELRAEPDDRMAMTRAVDRFVRESAFTHLNRLAALKILERRGLVPESISKGPESQGFRLFMRIAPEFSHSTDDRGYQRYLEMLFDEIALRTKALFDRSLPQSTVFPTPAALQRVLELINDEKLEPVWDQEETMGWVYQYFTPKDVREKARKESPAPRDSHELAFRNQFYTPAYVVQFLTDNTLGRLWYEAKPDTALVARCKYLIRKPGEALKPRGRLDPKEIRVLDPACGSGHFLLYAFELLATMYEEGGYPAEEIPGLILEHNLFGIDIDLRAVQIASLALSLKAWRYCPGAKVPEPNIVCAEPMPGDEGLFKEFLERLKSTRPTLARLAPAVWRELLLAGEAGSLLRPEKRLKDVIAEQKKLWIRAMTEGGPWEFIEQDFWSAGPLQPKLDFSDVSDESFWDKADNELVQALKEYSEEVSNGRTVSRRLFAHDGLQGIQFLDTMRRNYDVVLMNPPFGEPAKGSKAYLEESYPLSKHDLYATFVERGLGLLKPGGRLGAITSRTGFFLSTFKAWREEIILKRSRLFTFADLGEGVLDTAMVETAAYCLEVSLER